MWTLHVEDFGKIESADITVSPLTLFVGDNNSGKSYLLSLLYGLMMGFSTGEGIALSNFCEDSPEYKECLGWIIAIMSHQTEREPFDDKAYDIFERLFNRILQENREHILQSIFNANVTAGKISVTFQREENLFLEHKCDEYSSLVQKACHLFKFPFSDFVASAITSADAESNFRGVYSGEIFSVIQYVLGYMILGMGKISDSWISFLPTSRTGFMLTYPALVQYAFSRAYNRPSRKNPNFLLTMPSTYFLSNLAGIDRDDVDDPDKYQHIIRFIEKNILSGKILVSDDTPPYPPLPEFAYRADNMETSLPMFLTSDVVKEIAPLILTLQYLDTDVLFIEEPEMSLHPKLQQAMARTLIKIANVGTPVLAATHSDTILQHVNNMIKLNNLPEARRVKFMQRYGFDADDPISAENVAMYQFDVQGNGRTAVTRLSCGAYGFEIPTFYDPLETLLEQTRETEPDDPEDEE